jgi:hypothetical protein
MRDVAELDEDGKEMSGRVFHAKAVETFAAARSRTTRRVSPLCFRLFDNEANNTACENTEIAFSAPP